MKQVKKMDGKIIFDVNYAGRIVSEPFVLMGCEVGFSIKTWRNFVDDTIEEDLDNEAKFLLGLKK